jgi:hypothetical protein
MLYRLGLGAVLAIMMVNVLPGVAEAATGCDLEAMHHYPLTDVIKERAILFQYPIVAFPEPGRVPNYSFDIMLDEQGEAKARAALTRGLDTFKPIERPVLMLAASASWTEPYDGLSNFFLLEQGVYIDDVLATLDAEGLKEHAALIREGRALFGADYGTQADRYNRLYDGHGNSLDPILEAKLKALSARYRALPSILTAAVAHIDRSPELRAIYGKLLAQAPEEARFDYLAEGLWRCVNHYDAPEVVLDRLKSLPPPYANIIVARIFEAEMLNGAVEQFFFNSSGNFAPEVVSSLQAMGLSKHAEAVQEAIALFPRPYPRDLARRRDFMLAQGEDFAQRLEEITEVVDDGAIRQAMIRTAREADILPK